jgi:hypothetical protein
MKEAKGSDTALGTLGTLRISAKALMQAWDTRLLLCRTKEARCSRTSSTHSRQSTLTRTHVHSRDRVQQWTAKTDG